MVTRGQLEVPGAHLADGAACLGAPLLLDDATEIVVRTDQPLAALVEHVERAAIQQAMARARNHVEDAARFLGLSRKGL